MFKVVKTGKKTAKKGWKRMITKPTVRRPFLLLFRDILEWKIADSSHLVRRTRLYPTPCQGKFAPILLDLYMPQDLCH
jgi:hypothetical protein